jgi:transcriptional regulator
MYIPTAFEETDQEKLHAFIEGHSFGLLVSMLGGKLFATHLPFLLDREAGCLFGHLARANPHWKGLHEQEVLVVFSGPHTYISPALYESDNVVPTWNYVAVHVYGKCRLVEDPPSVEEILKKMVATYEGARSAPWPLDTATAYFQKMVQAVVGIRIDITRLEGKWKLNQNHPRERREKVVHTLAKSEDRDAREIARLMAEMLR